MSKGLEALKRLMADYYEMCQDLGNNDDQYQRCNLTSERAIIEKELKEHERYKVIEERLGIDLVIFHKALENGVYYKVTDKSSVNYGKIFFDRYVLWGWNQNSDGSYFAMMQSQLQSFNLKDYGKTWALTRKELEK